MKLAFAALALVALFALRSWLGGRTVDITPLAFLKVPWNAVAFRARRLVGFRRGPPELAQEPKDDLFAYEDDAAERARLEARERELRDRYALAPLRDASTKAVYRDALYTLDLLDRLVPDGTLAERDAVTALDVGSKDFRYAFALVRWLARRTREGAGKVSLVGIELDGHPVYPDLRSRADHAEAFAAQAERGTAGSEVRYRVGDFLASPERERDVVFVFFPFVLRYALVRWGLPLGHFRPASIFEHAALCLRSGGLLVVVNHTPEEHARQREILAEVAAFELLASAPAESGLVDYAEQTEGRRLTVARRR